MSGLKEKNKFHSSLIDIILLLFSSFLFAFSFPSFLFTDGLSFIAFFAFIPMFLVVHRMGWVQAPFYGLLYGVVSYAVFNYWLSSFHPLTIFIIPLLYAAYYFILFPVLKLAVFLFPKKSYILIAVIWVVYEYLRTMGFIGYSYGVIGYSQYLITPLVRLSSVTGVWGISFLIVLPSAFLGSVLSRGRRYFPRFIRECRRDILVYFIIIALVFLWGWVSRIDYSDAKNWKVAMIQQNMDPWHGGVATYSKSLDRLIKQSDLALKEDPDIVVWSETSFVPAIEWHTRYRTDQESYKLVKKLKTYLKKQDVPFIIGNDDGQLSQNENGNMNRIDYNAALLFEKGVLVQRYRKIHLVPFTEHFPYKKEFPWLYKLLENSDTHFWEKGDEYTVFKSSGVRFSTPICFEDTFGYLSRKYINSGAEVIVNISNDSWSASVAAEVQHMMHAVLRAAENRRSVVRSTNGGITCVIDPNGKIISRIDPFIESCLVADVPVYTQKSTIYTKYGDWFPILCMLVSLFMLLAGMFFRFCPFKAGVDKRSN